MVAFPNVYESLAELMASMDAARVLSFHAPDALQKRVESLIEKKKASGLTEAEKAEIEHYFILEHIIRLAKSRARLRLSKADA